MKRKKCRMGADRGGHLKKDPHRPLNRGVKGGKKPGWVELMVDSTRTASALPSREDRKQKKGPASGPPRNTSAFPPKAGEKKRGKSCYSLKGGQSTWRNKEGRVSANEARWEGQRKKKPFTAVLKRRRRGWGGIKIKKRQARLDEDEEARGEQTKGAGLLPLG